MADETDLIVTIASGQVRGTLVDGTPTWFSIPYGASTAGANRFRPPQPVAKWDGVRDARTVVSQAPQVRGAYPNRLEVADFFGKRDASPHSEDCLTVTVATPAPAANGQ